MNEHVYTFREKPMVVADLNMWKKAQLVLMWNEDYSLDQIAAKFGISIDSVEQYLSSKRGWPDILVPDFIPSNPVQRMTKVATKASVIRGLLKTGWNIREIAKHTGFCEDYIRNTRDSDLRKAGTMTPKRRLRQEIIHRFETTKLTPAEIARELKTSINYVYNIHSQLQRAKNAKLDTYDSAQF